MVKKRASLEVRKFLNKKIRKEKRVNKAMGISECKQYLQKKIEMSELIEKISIKTRQYAKRQSTWARGNMHNWKKLNPEGLEKFLKKI